MTFLNSFTVIVAPLGLKIDCIASISSSSVSGYLYSLYAKGSTLPWVRENQRIRISPYCLDQLLWSTQRVQPQLGFDWGILRGVEVTKLEMIYADADEIIVIFIEKLECLLKLSYLLLAELVTFIHSNYL
jgi:hypothetical protein